MPEDHRDPADSASPILAAICRQCLGQLPVDHASVALASGDGLWLPAFATSATAAELEQAAFALGEGPCFDALQRHTPMIAADLTDVSRQDRWPLWGPAASAAGVRSASALPIQAGAIVAGVLTLLSTHAGALSGPHLAQALRLADTALLGLLDLISGLETGAGDGAWDGATAVASRSRDVADLVRADVHQAAGMIMIQAEVPIQEALARLRARAFQLGRPVGEVANDVLARRISFAAGPNSAE